MTPRPRKASDEEIFAAVQRVMMRLGPNDVTLSEIAAEAGLTAGALVQRFGSKRELLLALMEQWGGGAREMFDGLRASAKTPLATIRLYAECMAAMGESPGALAHHLSYLQLDLTDPDFHRHAKRQAEDSREELRRLVAEAAAAGELPADVDDAAAARLIETTVSGSLMTWAFYQEGKATDWMALDLDRVLGLLGAVDQDVSS